MNNYLELARHEGNRALFDVIEMAIISLRWGVPLHFHAEGLRGTGKTTIMRAAKDIFPQITRIKGCLYNCDPQKPHCPEHKNLPNNEISKLETEEIPMPFLEISHSAKIGTIVGSIDLAGITDKANPTAAILPGIIPQAHRGVIFVDEINRLADTSPELTDVLLDVMGTKPGRIQIEETGLPVVDIPVQVSVWAASNPDEDPGPLQEIRRQLADRFDLAIDMKRTDDPDAIASILKLASHVHVQETRSSSDIQARNIQTRKELEKTAVKYAGLDLPDFLRNYIARIYVKYDIESFRAIEAIQHAALLNCALRQRDTVLISDIIKVLPLALRHRVDLEILSRIMNSTPGYSELIPVNEKPPTESTTLVNKVLNSLGLKNTPEGTGTSDLTTDLKQISEINLDELIRPEKP
ncbi:ATP-binding protein [Phosphitispora sp. TUW77]|uniref:ATP-binding protein n=1 Tax=Phosphitispora sp. TUW77 TaxID=3152361 RepID=UPI003AB3953A